MSHQRNIGYVLLAVFIAALLYVFGKGRALITGGSGTAVTAGSVGPLLQPDPVTGAPTYDSSNPATVPANIIGAPIANPSFPNDPTQFSCPIGYQLWKDVASGKYVCAQQGAPAQTNILATLTAAEGGAIIS